MRSILELKNINYSYHTPEGETPALSGISFALAPGEFAAVVGPSGCGKSTLLSLIAGLMTPDSGEITLNGKPLTENSSNIGYMLQHDHLFEWRSIEQNVLLTGVRYDLERIYQAMDVFVMPSLYEGFPISVLEAQASGLSCVLSDNITRDVGINQNVWYIALSKDIQMWADKITACLEALRLPEDLNRTAVEYDLNKNVKELVDVYEEL